LVISTAWAGRPDASGADCAVYSGESVRSFLARRLIEHRRRVCYIARLDFWIERKGFVMSMDRSLRSGSGLVRHRNVLTRAERIERMSGEGKWSEGKSVMHLPKLGNRKAAIAKAEPKADAAAAADPKAAGAKAAAPAAGAKAAAPAAGAKAAAPAAKAPAKK
jgi:small basic protein (TIGR04137 family)